MSLISMMELNARSPFLWDWENLVMLNQKAAAAATNEVVVPKKSSLQMVEYSAAGFGGAVEEGFEVGPLYSSEGGHGDGGGANGVVVSASDLGYGSSSKSSSKSAAASIDSSTNLEVKESRFIILSETTTTTNNDYEQQQQQQLSCKNELHSAWSGGISSSMPPQTTSASPGEWTIGLKLGKRTYFEDVSAGGGGGTSSSSVKMGGAPAPLVVSVETAVAAATRRSRSSSSSSSSPVVVIPRCQVEGCNLDLSSAKDYYRKHRICETHSKSPKVTVGGLERRFCQQCSRFHNLSEFDQKKRSCRKRLSDHNARRRKPKPNMMHFDSIRPSSSSFYAAARHQMGIAFNQVPPPVNPKVPEAKFCDTLLDPRVKLCPDPQQLNFLKGIQADFPSSSSHMDAAAARDLRALSLLSSNSWGSCESGSPLSATCRPPQPPPRASAMVDAVPLLLPVAPSAYWLGGHSVTPRDHHQEFQLFKDPQDAGFYTY
ncbi:hypothetical protein Dimus_015268 [Dionaea muscipula]